MPLTPGTRLGVYEVRAAIGEGGMGEVYRARDTRLDRDVALKILPEAFAHDPERVARFQREAKTLAALNHPNIGGIYGLEEAPGVTALVLELVEGPTLADRIAHGPIPINEALPIARQIAEALEAAHEHGIIHRDLKPANIKIREDGTVKVLDFGLAKALGPAEAGPHVREGVVRDGVGAGFSRPEATASPTITSPAMMTGVGVILGTAAYMAPEQAKGKAADKRSDLWAFGCVLYEMLTGKRTFDGDDLAEVFGAVVRLDPDWTAVPADIPLPVRALLRTCLTKDPRKRKIEATTALFVLDNAASMAPAPVSQDAAGAHREWFRSVRRRVVPVAAAAAVVTGAIVGTGVWFTTRPTSSRVVRMEVTTAGAAALSIQGNGRDIAITPDGSRIIYRGDDELVVRALDQLQPSVLGGLGAPQGVFVSPDGQWVGFFDASSSLKKVAITGGPPVTITLIDGSAARGGTWGPDGTIVYATNNGLTGLQRVPAAGGEPLVLTRPSRERSEAEHFWPEFLPGGQAVLCTIVPTTGGLDNAQIAVLDLRTGMHKMLLRGGHHAHYVPTGHLVYGAGGSLRAVPFDLDQLETTGTPVPVLGGVVTSATGGVDVAIAVNGTMVYVPGRGVGGPVQSLLWVDRAGREEPIPAPPRNYIYPRLSPDGTRVALYAIDLEQDIWVWHLARQTLTRLTLDPALDYYPVWTPDGRGVLFSRVFAAGANIYWQAADGTGTPEQLSRSDTIQHPSGVSPDGRILVFDELGPMARDLMVLKLDGVPGPQGPGELGQTALREVKPLLQTRFEERNGIVSPDGRWLAYESDASGRFEIYVRPFPNVDGGQWQISTASGTRPLWSRNGQELFYIGDDGALMAVRVEVRGGMWGATAPIRILEGRYFTGVGTGLYVGRTYDVAPDGRRFLMLKQAGDGETTALPRNLIVVQNWHEELKRLVPTN